MSIYGELAGKGAKGVADGLGTLFITIFVLVVMLLAACGVIIYLLVR